MQNNKPWADREWHTGDWACSKCGAKIDRLPFEPDPNRIGELLCKDCHRAKMQAFKGRGFGGGRR